MAFALYEENIDKFTFIDMLNRLEKAEILDAREWNELRDIGNELAHDYDDEPMHSSMVLNKVYERENILETVYQNIKVILTQ